MAVNSTSIQEENYMIGPTIEFRIKTQISLLALLLIFSILSNGTMLVLFARFKALRRLSNYFLIDLLIVEFLDTIVNVPIFMEFFLFTKKRHLEKQTRWFAMLFHRYFILNDLFTQLAQIVDCFLAITYGKRFTSKKTSVNVTVSIAMKWVIILVLLLIFSIPTYTAKEEAHVSDEAYQRLLFGPNQVIWKIVIPICQAFGVVLILLTNRIIHNSRQDISNRYGMMMFGKGTKNSSKAINTLILIMFVQTVCKVPAAAYSYVAVDDRVEGNRWFAFSAYFFLFISSSVMPVIYFCRTMSFRRAFLQFIRRPLTWNAYLDYAAFHGVKYYRNGRLHRGRKTKSDEKVTNEHCFVGNEPTKGGYLYSRSSTQTGSRSTTEASILELPVQLGLMGVNNELSGVRAERNSVIKRTLSVSLPSELETNIADPQDNKVLTNDGSSLQEKIRKPESFDASGSSKVKQRHPSALELENNEEQEKIKDKGSIVIKESVASVSISTTSNEDKPEPTPEFVGKDQRSSKEEENSIKECKRCQQEEIEFPRKEEKNDEEKHEVSKIKSTLVLVQAMVHRSEEKKIAVQENPSSPVEDRHSRVFSTAEQGDKSNKIHVQAVGIDRSNELDDLNEGYDNLGFDTKL